MPEPRRGGCIGYGGFRRLGYGVTIANNWKPELCNEEKILPKAFPCPAAAKKVEKLLRRAGGKGTGLGSPLKKQNIYKMTPDTLLYSQSILSPKSYQ